MVDPTVDATAELTDLHDDLLVQVLALGDVGAVAVFSAVCRRFALLAQNNELWRQLVAVAWPLLPPAIVETTPHSWCDFYRGRSAGFPCWRYYLIRMDEIEHLLNKLLARGTAATGAEFEEFDRLALCLIKLWMVDESHSVSFHLLCHTSGRRWAQRLCALIGEPGGRTALNAWTTAILLQLDDYYDPTLSREQLQHTLLRSLRCASALTILQDEIAASLGVETGVAPERVAEALRSLEMEGFDVSVKSTLLPARLPYTGHQWWRAQTRQGYLGGVTNIR